jgi:MFS family permease
VGIFLKDYITLVVLWALLGVGYSLSQTPGGRLLRRSSTAEDRPALFAAQFALSHSCWLVTYPLAGWVGAAWGTQASFIALTVVATLSLVTAVLIWRPEHEVYAQVHSHKDPETNNESTHEHDFVIDDEHPSWPKKVISQKDNVSGEDKPIKSVTMALIHIILSLPPGEDKP